MIILSEQDQGIHYKYVIITLFTKTCTYTHAVHTFFHVWCTLETHKLTEIHFHHLLLLKFGRRAVIRAMHR